MGARTHYRSISRQIGLRYEPLVAESVPNPTEPLFGGDMRIDLRELERVVRTTLAE